MKKEKSKIFTDGSCLGNPGPGGWAAIIFDDDKKHVISGNDAYTTNNRMEMMAVIGALKWLKKNKKNYATIFSDSSLLIQTLTKNWKRKKNKDLWTEIDNNLKGINIDWQWVKGHASNEYNNLADEIAVMESEKAKRLPKKPAVNINFDESSDQQCLF
jgi:ribonuclease HI